MLIKIKLVFAKWLAVLLYSLFAPKRKYTGEPACVHALRVAGAYRHHMPNDHDGYIVALYHDILEDTPFPEAVIRALFGDVVCDGVKRLTDNVPISPRKVRKAQYAETIAESSRMVRRVKILDLLDNYYEIRRYDSRFFKTYLIEVAQYIILFRQETVVSLIPGGDELFEVVRQDLQREIDRDYRSYCASVRKAFGVPTDCLVETIQRAFGLRGSEE